MSTPLSFGGSARLFPFREEDGKINYAFAVLALLLITERIMFYRMTWFTTDDAFITYRYARNIVSGLGFVFNPGEHVQGTSSPLYTLWLAALGGIFGTSSIPMLSRLTGIVADVVSLAIMWSIFSPHGKRLCVLVAAFFALYPKIVLIAISGMEAPVVLMFMLLIWRWYSSGRFDLVFICSALLLLTRLDAALWLILIGIAIYIQYKSVPVVPAIVAAALYGSWIGFCYWYFGSWIPNSVIAKGIAWNHMFSSFDPTRIFLGYLPGSKTALLAGGRTVVVIALLVAPVVLEAVLCLRKKSDLLIFPAFFILYNIAFAFGRVIIPDWYYYPGYIAYIVTCAHLLARALPFLRTHIPVQALPAVRLVLLLTVFFLLGAAYRSGGTRWADNPGGLFLRQNDALGIWLKNNANPASHVLVEPIGYIGWESNLYIDDYIGLVSPPVVDYRTHALQSDRWYMSYIRDHTPDYIVQRNWEYPQNKLFHGYGEGMFTEPDDREWFDKHYSLVNWDPHVADRDSVYLVLYEKTDTTPLFGMLPQHEVVR